MRVYRKPKRIIQAVHDLFGSAVPENFDVMFARAFLTFRHQIIYNVETRTLGMLTPPNTEEDYWWWKMAGVGDGSWEDLSFLGYMIDDARIARGVVNGDLHPVDHVPWGPGHGEGERERRENEIEIEIESRGRI